MSNKTFIPILVGGALFVMGVWCWASLIKRLPHLPDHPTFWETLHPPTLDITELPYMVKAAPGEFGRAQVSLIPVNGLHGNVALRLEGAPPGVRAVFEKPSVPLDGFHKTFTGMRIAVSRDVLPGKYDVTVTASARLDPSDGAPILLVIPGKQKKLPFYIADSHLGYGVVLGTECDMRVDIACKAGYDQRIHLSLQDDPSLPVLGKAGDPKKVSVEFTPPDVYGAGESLLKIHVGKQIPLETYHFWLTATSNSGARQIMPVTIELFREEEEPGDAAFMSRRAHTWW